MKRRFSSTWKLYCRVFFHTQPPRTGKKICGWCRVEKKYYYAGSMRNYAEIRRENLKRCGKCGEKRSCGILQKYADTCGPHNFQTGKNAIDFGPNWSKYARKSGKMPEMRENATKRNYPPPPLYGPPPTRIRSSAENWEFFRPFWNHCHFWKEKKPPYGPPAPLLGTLGGQTACGRFHTERGTMPPPPPVVPPSPFWPGGGTTGRGGYNRGAPKFSFGKEAKIFFGSFATKKNFAGGGMAWWGGECGPQNSAPPPPPCYGKPWTRLPFGTDNTLSHSAGMEGVSKYRNLSTAVNGPRVPRRMFPFLKQGGG